RGTSFWRVAALAASIVLAGALGSTLLERPAIDQPVGVQPSPTVAPSAPAASASPTATPAPQMRVFFVRDLLPPVSASINGGPGVGASREARIGSRLAALRDAPAPTQPGGLSNP